MRSGAITIRTLTGPTSSGSTWNKASGNCQPSTMRSSFQSVTTEKSWVSFSSTLSLCCALTTQHSNLKNAHSLTQNLFISGSSNAMIHIGSLGEIRSMPGLKRHWQGGLKILISYGKPRFSITQFTLSITSKSTTSRLEATSCRCYKRTSLTCISAATSTYLVTSRFR